MTRDKNIKKITIKEDKINMIKIKEEDKIVVKPILKKLNFIVESTPNQSPPNLLDRDFEIVFFTQKQVDDSGFTSFIRDFII